MKLRVLFYKAKFDDHLLDDGISLWTGLFNWGTGPYSHAEIWIPNTDVPCREGQEFGVTMEQFYPAGTCYTSTMRDEVNGVVKRPAAQVLKHSDRWDYIEIEISDDLYADMVEWMDYVVRNNPGYDIKCILSFFWFRRWYKDRKYICSEFCEKALQEAGVLKSLRCPSPRRLSRWLVDKGYKIESLAGR